MDLQRAKEIANSPVMADVTLEGTPIYIRQVDEEKKTCIIHALNQNDVVQEVPVGRLQEWTDH